MSDRPWINNYPNGVPANIDTSTFPTVVSMAEEAFKKYKKRPCFSNMGKTISYQDLDKLSSRFGAYLLSRGLQPGDRIALMMPNLLQYPIALFGALRAGLVVVNTNPLYTPREMKHQFVDSGAVAIVIATNFASNLEKILGETAIKTIILTDLGEMLGFPKRTLVNFVVKNVKRLVPKYELPNTVMFSDALKQGKSFSLPKLTTGPSDTILIQYTGGTTGVSKGACLTNLNLVANNLQIQHFFTSLKDEGEIALSPLPMYHIFAFTLHCLALMCGCGVHSVLVTNPRDQKSLIKEFKKYKISIVSGVNTLFNALTLNPEFEKQDFSSLRISIAGGMALQKSVAQKWQQITGQPLIEGYGMTEASPVTHCNPVDGSGQLGSIGVPLSSTDARVVSDSGEVLAVGEIGELQIKGPQVMKGYHNRPEETAETLKDGWLCTGDIALMQEDGYFKIVDRKKDMILVSGFNVYPNEIEELLAGHPKISEAAAIGLPSEKSGESIKVFVVRTDKSLTEADVTEFCKTNLTGYKIPKIVEFRKALPKSNVGKILRKELRQEEMAKNTTS